MSNLSEFLFNTERWNNIWNSSNENEFKIEGRTLKEIKEEINLQRKLRENISLSKSETE